MTFNVSVLKTIYNKAFRFCLCAIRNNQGLAQQELSASTNNI